MSRGQVKQDIEHVLERNARTDANSIQVEVDGGKVNLRGVVASYAEKEAAEDAACTEPGVAEIKNQIIVA